MSKGKIALLILIIGTVAGIAYVGGQQLLGNKYLKPVEVEKATLISSEITPPDATIFNDKAINPTVIITIGENDQSPIGQ